MVNIKPKGNTTNPSKPIWDEYIVDGRSTLEIHKPVKIWEACKNHYFVIVDQDNYQCRKCGFGQKFVWGIYKLQKGKIVKIRL